MSIRPQPIKMGMHQIQGLADGVDDYDAVNVRQLNPALVRTYLVAALPSPSAGIPLAFVSNATSTTPRSIVAGGGANFVMVMSNGTNWLIVA